MGFRGKVRVPNAALQSRSNRERKVSIYISEELLRLVYSLARDREWDHKASDGRKSVRMVFSEHDAIRLALAEWVEGDQFTAGRLQVFSSVRPVEPFSSMPSKVQHDSISRRRRYRESLAGVETFTGGLFYDFRDSEE